MLSAEVKLVFGLEPSGLLEKVIRAPEIGAPRPFPIDAVDVELEVVLAERSGLFGVTVSFLGTVGNFIFGIEN